LTARDPLRDPLGTDVVNTLGPELEKSSCLERSFCLAVSSMRSSCSVVHSNHHNGDELGLILGPVLGEVLGKCFSRWTPYLESAGTRARNSTKLGTGLSVVTRSTRTDAVEDTGTRAEQHLAEY
jgi:hypothetical protein